MHNQFLKTLGDNRPQIVTIGIVAIFAAMLGCGGGGGGGGGTTSTTSTTSTSTTSTSTTSTSTTSTSTTAGTTSETTGSTGSTLPANRIFFVDTTQDVKHINPDGTDEQTYTPIDPGFQGFAQSPVDPNKKAFAFTSVTPDPANGVFAQYDIYVNSSVSLTGATKLTSIAKADVGSIMFTPDGSQIVFTMATGAMVPGDDGPVPEYSNRLYVIASDVQNQTPVSIDAADDAYVAPTGLKIVYTNWPLSAPNPQVKICNIDGTDKLALTNAQQHGANYLPQYSKDGTQICFGSTRSAKFEIWKMSSGGSSPVQVTNINATTEDRCYGSSFNSAGSEIAFSRLTLSDGSSGVYRVPSGGGTEVQIRPGFIQSWVYWSPVAGSMPGRSPGTASSPLSFGTSARMKKFLGIDR